MKNVFGIVLSLALAFGFVPSQGVACAWAAGDGEGQVGSLVASAADDAQEVSGDAAQEDSQAASAASAQADTQANSSWRSNIDALLDAGSYAEGEVVIVAPVEADTEDAMHGALGADSSVERIYETDGAVFEEASGESISKDVLADAQKDDGAVSAGDVEIATFLLRAPSLTTRQLLEALSKETCVLDASPNYLYSIDDDAFGQDGEANDDDTDAADDVDETDESGAESVNEADNADNAESADESEKTDIDASWIDGANAEAEPNANEGSLPETSEADGSDAVAFSVASADSAIATYAAAPSSFVPNAAKDVTASADATSWQWALNRGALPFKTARDGNAVVSDSTWNTGTANATGVVAVFDTGVDYTHPDLQNAMMDMSPYVGKIGGTLHGYNAVNEKAEPLDDVGHGTHVAGIIAASTNGFGVSGAANGVKLLPVKAIGSNGTITTASIQRGYAYLKKAIQAGVDVRVVNNSWAGSKVDSMVNYVVTDLGAMGAVSVFAAGNAAANMDKTQWTATGLQYNQYAVVVNSLDMNALASAFTNYGAGTTDVFAPGSSILSTTRTDQAGKYNAAAMRGSSSTFVTFNGASNAIAATSDKGKAVGSYDANSGYDKDGGCLTISGSELVGLPRPSSTSTKATKRVWLNVPVDESKLSEASMVGCAVRFTGKLGADAWLEVQDSDGNTLSDSNETEVVDNGNWQTLSLDLNRACADHNRSIGVFRDARGKAYIKVAVCLKATRLQASTASLSIDCVGVGSQSWHYGFMSGTSMAAPLVSAYAAVLASKIPNYSSLEVTARACKVANLVCTSAKKLGKLNGLCATGGVVNPSAFADAIAADAKTPYLGDVIFEESTDGAYMTVTMVGIGFGQQQGSIIVKAFDDSGLKYTIVSWSDTKIVYTMSISKRGSSKVTTTVENTSGNKTAASTSSILSGDEDDEPDQPEEPEEPSKPATPGGASDSGSGSAASSGSAGEGGSGTSGAAGVGNANASQPVLGSSSSAQGNDASTGAFAETGDAASPWMMLFLLGAFIASGTLVLATRERRRL